MSYSRRLLYAVIAILFGFILLITWLHATATSDVVTPASASGRTGASATSSTGTSTTYYQNGFGVVAASRVVPDKQASQPRQTSLPQNAGDRTEIVMTFFGVIMLGGVVTYILRPQHKEWHIPTMW